MDINLEELAREIAVRMAPEALLTADDVGALLGCTARYVRERFAELENFPKPIRFKLDHESYTQPRWKRSELYDYIEAHGLTEIQHRKRSGRPRNVMGRLTFS